MKKLRQLPEIWRLVRSNWKTLAVFELFYKLAVAVLFIPLLSGSAAAAMQLTGYAYLTVENVRAFAVHPLTVGLVLVLLIFGTMLAMIDIGAVLYALDLSGQGKKARLWQVIRFAVRTALRAGHPRNLALSAVTLLLAPFLNIGLACGILSAVSVPEFFMRFIHRNGPLCAVVFAGWMLLSLLMMRRLYVFHYFALEGCGFREARRRSAALSRGHLTGDFGMMLVAQLLFSAGSIAVVIALALTAVGLGKVLTHLFVLQWLTSTAVRLGALVSLVITFAMSTPVSYGCACALFYRHKAEAGEAICPVHAPDRRPHPGRERRLKVADACAAALIIAAGFLLAILIESGRLNPQIEYIRTMEVTAHRGASAFYPENTMAAIRGARELGADWVELDVQQTRDGQIIVLHDANTRRTTGYNGNTWEMDYAQIAGLDAGRRFGRAFAGERIPLLSEVAEYARETGLRLNIELKPSGHETDFEQGVIDILKAYGIEEDCVITSQVYGVLKNVKACDENITTVYVMGLAYGDINQLTAADHFSVEATSATRRLVSRVHNAGKQIYAWTVNTEDSINRMIDRHVDNIITDDIELARRCVIESKYSDLLSEVVRTLDSQEP